MEQNHILENKDRSPRPIRILGIAPYKGMKAIMQGLAAERDDIDLDVFIGDLEQGVEIVQRNIHILLPSVSHFFSHPVPL